MSKELVVWVVEEQNRHGVDVDVYHKMPDIKEWMDYTDAEIIDNGPDGWLIYYGSDEWYISCTPHNPI